MRNSLRLLSLMAAVAGLLAACSVSPNTNPSQTVVRSDPSNQSPINNTEQDVEALHRLVKLGLRQRVADLDLWTPEDAAQDLGKQIGDLSSTQIKLGTSAVDDLLGVLKCCTLACTDNLVTVLDDTYEVTAGAPFDEVCLNAAGLLRGIASSNKKLVAPRAGTLKTLLHDAERHITRRPSDLRFKGRLAILLRILS